jgi:hypothetical protein
MLDKCSASATDPLLLIYVFTLLALLGFELRALWQLGGSLLLKSLLQHYFLILPSVPQASSTDLLFMFFSLAFLDFHINASFFHLE